MAGISLRGITKNFGSTRVLKGIDLDIADGEFLTLVGASGCGKSTLLRIIAGLEDQTAGDKGLAVTKVIYDGIEGIVIGEKDDMKEHQAELVEEVTDLLPRN